jgi:hypothetical protein
MTFEGMKPMTPDAHLAIAAWVEQGGILIFFGDDAEAYNRVRAWWNDTSKGMSYDAPREHLFTQLGLPKAASTGAHSIGRGALFFDQRSPAALSRKKGGAVAVLALVRNACERAGIAYHETSHLAVSRGPYVVAAGLSESRVRETTSLSGHFLNLFDPDLAVLESVKLTPGSRYFLLDLDRVKTPRPAILASAFKALDAKLTSDGTFEFYAEGPSGVEAVVRVAMTAEPKEIRIDDRVSDTSARSWHAATKTLFLRFPNSISGRRVAIR